MKERISRLQYFFLIPNLLFGKAIGITVGIMVRHVGADTWISMLIGFFTGTLLFLIMLYICSKFPEKNIIQFSEEIFGRWVGKVTGIILTLFFTVAFAVSANVMTLHIKQYFLLETPMLLICVAFTLLCMYGAYLGVEVVLRFAMLAIIMTVLINVTMITGSYGDFEVNRLRPIFDSGLIRNVSTSVYFFVDTCMVILSVGYIYPLLNIKKNIVKISIWSIALSIILIIPWPLFEVAVMGHDTVMQYAVVCMQQIRCAQLTRYLPRYELVMVSFYMFCMFVQSVAMYYCCMISIKQTTGIKKDRILILLLGVILIIITYIMSYDNNTYIEFLDYPWAQICTMVSIGLPVLLLITALSRGKLAKQNTKKSKA